DNDSKLDTGEASTVTSASGQYSFTVAPGTYTVRQVIPKGWYQTVPLNNAGRTATVTAGATVNLFAFGSARYASIRGTGLRDANGNRLRDHNEGGLSNGTVYRDADNDGVLDAAEVRTTSDSSGNWIFNNLTAGTHRVRIVQKSGWALTTPLGGAFTHSLFSGT